jgi:hypothetical protein
MALGVASQQLDLLDPVSRFCAERLPANSIFAFLAGQRQVLFPDVMFADLFADNGRRSVPPSVVAAVMVLQRLEGLSDREATDRFTFDVGWRHAAGVGGWDSPQHRISFAHTVLVDMRERLRRSDRPDRIFEMALDAARSAGLIGRKRVLDSTPLFDAVATMDTITLIRSAIRGLLAAADTDLAGRLRTVLGSGDDYTSTGKPVIDWDDKTAREALMDSRARDGSPCWSSWTPWPNCPSRCGRRCGCWPRCWVRTWKPARTRRCASPGRSPPIGSSPPWIPGLDTGTRPATGPPVGVNGPVTRCPTLTSPWTSSRERPPWLRSVCGRRPVASSAARDGQRSVARKSDDSECRHAPSRLELEHRRGVDGRQSLDPRQRRVRLRCPT